MFVLLIFQSFFEAAVCKFSNVGIAELLNDIYEDKCCRFSRIIFIGFHISN